MNFVDGNFEKNPVPKWGQPIKGERIPIATFKDATNSYIPGVSENYFTLQRTPSWERDKAHETAVTELITGFLYGSTWYAKKNPSAFMKDMVKFNKSVAMVRRPHLTYPAHSHLHFTYTYTGLFGCP
jgi:hypothetical protein